jgi:hypothetical protein
MAADLTRRGVLGGMAVTLTAMPGCVRLSGCEDQSKYILILTAVDRDAVRTEPIAYQDLSTAERRLVEKTLAEGRYELMVVTAGDNDPGKDCRHSPFDVELSGSQKAFVRDRGVGFDTTAVDTDRYSCVLREGKIHVSECN